MALGVVVMGCAAATGPVIGPAKGAAAAPEAVRFGYFGRPDRADPWSAPVTRWQRRVRAESRAPSPVSSGRSRKAPSRPATSELSASFESFRAAQKRGVAREVTRWIQEQAKAHFVPDGAIDRWPTFEETLAANGDDCDGLALVAYRLLRELGFGEQELYQAIVYQLADGQHHMVTLWFEDREDPWVIDPTAAMVGAMVQMSSVPGWRPIKIFSETEEYTVRLPEAPDVPAVATSPPSDDEAGAEREPRAPSASPV